jgi:hypothetical protein
MQSNRNVKASQRAQAWIRNSAFLAAVCLSVMSTRAVTIFTPGNDTLLIGIPDPNDPNSVLDGGFILRTPQQQQAGITTFSSFPAGTFDLTAGIVVILNPGHYVEAAQLSALGLTVGNLGALNQWSPGLFHGVFGIAAPGAIGFGGSAFIDSFGIAGSPVQFYVQDYTHTGLDANAFLTQQGLDNRYRLGFETEPAAPFSAPDSGSTLLLFATTLAICAVGAMAKTLLQGQS